jgi:hypothetical protein
MDLRAAMALSGLVAGRYVDRRQAPPNNLGSTIGCYGANPRCQQDRRPNRRSSFCVPVMASRRAIASQHFGSIVDELRLSQEMAAQV